MTNRTSVLRCTAIAIASAGIFVVPAIPQEAASDTFKLQEQSFGIATWNAACDIGKSLISNVGGQVLADAAASIAQSISLCPKPGEAPKPVASPSSTPTTPGGAGAPPMASVSARPGFEMQIVKVDLRNATEPKISLAAPDTKYAKGDGFVLMMTANSPGFMQIWTVDAATKKLVEEVALNGAAQSMTILPANYQQGGFYAFETDGGTDFIEIRYLPCKHSQAESFAVSVNKTVAEKLKPFVDSRVVAMNAAMSPCAPTDEARDQLLRQATFVQPSFNPDRNRYLAVSTGSGALAAEFKLPRTE